MFLLTLQQKHNVLIFSKLALYNFNQFIYD